MLHTRGLRCFGPVFFFCWMFVSAHIQLRLFFCHWECYIFHRGKTYHFSWLRGFQELIRHCLLLMNLSTESSQQADRGEGGSVCFQDDVMTTHPYLKDEISGLCQHSNTVEPTTYAKLNCDLAASQSQPTDALVAHTIPLGQGVCVLILGFLLETFACQCYIYCSIGFQVMSICASVVTLLLVNHQQAEVALILNTFLSPFLEGYTQEDRLLCS